MIKKIFFWGFAAVSVVLGALSPAAASELRDIALSADADSAQLTLDLTDVAPQRLFTLEHPDRVVVDLLDTHRAGGVHAPAPSGVVTEVRFGVQPHGTLRVVLQLRSALTAPGRSAARVVGWC